jgi:signal transduction histidine kinase
MQRATQTPLTTWIKTVSVHLKTWGEPLQSADYEAWRQSFLLERLRLSCRLMFYCFLSLTAFLIVAFPLYTSTVYWLTRDVAVLLGLVLCSVLQKTALGRKHPDAIFLGLCWSMTWFSQLSFTLLEHGDPAVPMWTLVFLALAAAIPIRWTLHLTAQVGVVASYIVINAMLGQRFNEPLHEQFTTWLCLFWVCFICNLAVYLYERLRRAEFEARRELQTFVQTVSQELRGPSLRNLNRLKQVLNQVLNQAQAEDTVAIARPFLEDMRESSNRQLTLIESLLERAKHTAKATAPTPRFYPSRLTIWIQAVLTTLETLKTRLEPRFEVKASRPDLKAPPSSTDYEAWRYRLLMKRLRLVWWIAIVADLTLSIPTLYEVLTGLKDASILLSYGFVLLALLVWFGMYQSPLGQSQPALLFLGFAASITVVSQMSDAALGLREPSIFVWTLVFLMLATLIPVQWGLHVAAQTITVTTYLVTIALLGIPTRMDTIHMAFMIWYVGWVFLICDLAVYTYERLQQAEFESRRQLQIFLHSVAHDLRTPVLGTGMVLSNLLRKASDPVILTRSALERMVQGGDRQLRLINVLLDAHMDIGKGITCVCEPVQLKALIQAIATDMEPLVAQSRMTLLDQVPPDLPLVNADTTQLWRVFENLIGNVLKYNPPGVTLTLAATRSPHSIRCIVQDNGVGIPSDLQPKIFDLYSRGSRVRRSPGLGLGLYLCRQIVTAHGGDIGVVSQPGKGSTFWFTLPLA